MKKTAKIGKKGVADNTGAPNGQGTVSNSTASPPIQIPGDQVMKESKKSSAGFKRGGAVQTADGNCPPGRMDKKRRGGRVTMRGRSPISAAGSLSSASTKTTH